jgi:hypothetical protein
MKTAQETVMELARQSLGRRCGVGRGGAAAKDRLRQDLAHAG